ncbi:hypothetical protein GEMRC1_002163 [Eukaryota sp. GEM-RC1]
MGVRGFLGFVKSQFSRIDDLPYLERISIHWDNEKPYYFAVDLGNFKSSIIREFLPHCSSGFSAADMIYKLRQLFSKLKECNIFFVFYMETISNQDFLRKTSNLDVIHTDKQCSSSSPVDARARETRPAILTWIILSAALGVNDSCSDHKNCIRIVEGEGDPFLANAVQRGEIDAVLSEDSDFCIFEGCKLALLRSNWNNLLSRLDRNLPADINVFDSTKFREYIGISQHQLVDLATMMGCDTTKHLVERRKLSTVLADLSNNLRQWNEKLTCNPDSSLAVQVNTARDFYDSVERSCKTIQCTSVDEVVQLKLKLQAQIPTKVKVKVQLSSSENENEHLKVKNFSAKHYVIPLNLGLLALSLKDKQSVMQFERQFYDPETKQTTCDEFDYNRHLPSSPPTRDSKVFSLLYFLESQSRHQSSEKSHVPDIHNSWFEMLEHLYIESPLLYQICIYIRYLNQRRVFFTTKI